MGKRMKVMRVKNMDSREYTKKRSIKYLLIVIAGIIVLAGIVLGITMVVVDIMQSTNAESGEYDYEKVFTEEDSLSYVVVSSKEIDDDIVYETFTLVKFSPKRGDVAISTLPKETAVSFDGWSGTLGNVIAENEAKYVIDAIESVIDYRLSGYVVLDKVTTQKLINLFNGVSVTIPEDIISSVGNTTYVQGTRRLIGQQAMEVIQYDNWSDGNTGKLIMNSKIHAALINENVKGGTAETYENYFSKIYNVIKNDTNISSVDFEKAKNGIVSIAALNEGTVCKIIEAKGTYTESGEFILDSDSLSQITECFKSDDV